MRRWRLSGNDLRAPRSPRLALRIAIRSDAPLRVTPSVGDLTGPATIPAAEVQLFRGNRTRLVRLPLRGPRGLKRVNDLRFGIQSGVPKPWRGGHDLRVTLRVSNLRPVP
jgi:hypothetical protein